MKRPYYRSLKPLLLWRQGQLPLAWPNVFGANRPLCVELGYGNGDYLIQESQRHPDRNFVGIEMAWPSTSRALRRIDKHAAGNVRLILDNARTALEHAFPILSIDSLTALFPCPWPKDRHEKHRLFNARFLSLMHSRLKLGADARIVTDDAGYRDWVLEQGRIAGIDLAIDAIPPRFGTRYEDKWHRAGQNIFYALKFTKSHHKDFKDRGILALQGHAVEGFNYERFSPEDRTGPVTLVFKDSLYDPARKKAMVHVVVVEDELRQEGWILIEERGGKWSIYPARGWQMIPTAGVQHALDAVRDAALKTV